MLRRDRVVLLALALSVLLPSFGMAGEVGLITLVNGTPYNWRTSEQSSNQMSSWDFPDVITAGSTATVSVEWSDASPRSSQSGVVTFSLEGTEDLSFQLQAAAPNEVSNLSVVLTNLATLGHALGSLISLGWNPNGSVNFILAGETGSFTSSKPPNAWMHENLSALGSRSLRNLCIPGSHDAGMSKFKTGTSLAKPCNTVTQTKGVLQQLHAGARYFDVRPVKSRGQLYTGHYSCDVQQGCQGAIGQSLDSIIDDVNSYIAAHQELVVLSLSNDLNTDTEPDSSFTEGEWCSLLSRLTNLKNRFVAPNPATVDLTTLTLGDFISGRAAVVVVGKPSNGNLTLDTLGCGFVPAERGFYRPQSFPLFDSFSNTNDLDFMQQDQLAKLQAHDPEEGAFLLSWTLTLQGEENLTCSNTILGLAAQAHPALYQNVLPASNRRTPNILSVDKVESRDIAALAMAVNSKASWYKPQGYVIYRELDNGISVAHTPNSDLAIGTDWRRTPMSPAIKTSATPAAVSFAGGLHVLYKGENDSQIYLAQPKGGNILDGESWNAKLLTPAMTTSTTPGAAVLGNTLYMFYKGEDNSNVYIARSSGNISDDNSWSSNSLNSAIQTNAAPAVAAFNNSLYLFYKEADGSIHIASSTTGNVFDGNTWSQSPLTNIATSDAPAAVVYKDALYLFYRGSSDHHIYVAYPNGGDPMDGAAWTSVRLFPGIATTSVPRPVVIGDSLYMFYKGLETYIWIAWSQDNNVTNGDGWTLRNLNTAINTGVGPGAAAM